MQDRIIFLILFVGCVWLILDMFFGAKNLSKIASKLVEMSDKPIQSVKDEAKEMQKVPSKDEYRDKGGVGIPAYDDIFSRFLPDRA